MDQKYNVGDKVLVVDQPVECVFEWVEDMDQYCGAEATIIEYKWSEVFKDHLYRLDVDDGVYAWCENCLSECIRHHEVDVFQVALELFAGV